MYKYLFFDDQKLYRRENLARKQGVATPIADSVYLDDGIYSVVGSPYVFKLPEGGYRGIYLGSYTDNKDYLMAIESTDGIHFTPRDVSEAVPMEGRFYPNMIGRVTEIAEAIEDPTAPPEERYKLFYIEVEGLDCNGYCMVSPDLIHWTDRREYTGWNNGSEPPSACVYNKEEDLFYFYVRPDWGQRRVGYKTTRDFKEYSPYQLCLQCDAEDPALMEIYGMKAIPYGNGYLGLAVTYRDADPGNVTKFNGGIIEAQLAYSADGRYWRRALHAPFLSGMTAETEAVIGKKCPMIWPGTMRVDEKGDLLIHASVNPLGHGYGWRDITGCRMLTYRVQKDRMLMLETEDQTRPSVVSTRENIWNGGELHVNIDCKQATLAVYESQGKDVLGNGRELPGYAHEDCVPFSGDATDWVPQFKNGKTLDGLKGKTLIFEIKFTDGRLYAIEGDCVPLMNLEGARYRHLGIVPEGNN